MYIGKRLETLRKSQKMSLTELALKSGVQLATLSRIENSKMVGTIESHINIARALGIEITELYKDLDKTFSKTEIHDVKNRTDIFTHSEHSSYEILTKNILQKKMMPTLIKIESMGKTNTEQNQNGTEKFIFIIEGTIEADIGRQKFKLNKNNALYFDASNPHYFINIGKTIARILAINTPVAI